MPRAPAQRRRADTVDAIVRVSLLGIKLVTIDARIVRKGGEAPGARTGTEVGRSRDESEPTDTAADADLASERRREVVKRLHRLSDAELASLFAYEARTRARANVLVVLRQAFADRRD